MEQEEISKKEPEKTSAHKFKIFDLYDLSGIQIADAGLKNVINLSPKLSLKTQGRMVSKLGQTKVNIVERLIHLLAVPGHRGKKQRIQTCWSSGKYNMHVRIVLGAFKIMESKGNPIQVLVKAVENSAPKDEVTTIEYGGAKYPQNVKQMLEDVFKKLVFIDAAKIAIEAGNIRAANTVLLGAMSNHLDLPIDCWNRAIETSVDKKYVELNKKAFAAGRNLH